MRPVSAEHETEHLPAPGANPRLAHAKEPERRLVHIAPDIVRVLPDERLVRIEVNGSLAGTVLAIPDAPRELAAGWAFMHGFFDASIELGRITVEEDRVSLMVSSGEDIDRRRLEAVGWKTAQPLSGHERELGANESFTLPETALLRLIDATWKAFRRDGGTDGFLHVAIATGDSARCIARDRTIDVAAAKVFGWTLLTDHEEIPSVLIVRGIVGRRLVEAAARLGISVIVTSAIPTAEAYRAAAGLSLTLIGMAMSKSLGLLIDGGHITDQNV